MDQENKLLKFQNAVFEEIDFKIAKMKEDSLMQSDKTYEDNLDARLAQAYNEIQAKIQEIKRNAKRGIAKFSLESKRELLKKREELTNSVFDSVLKRLDEYVKTDEYKKKLISKIASFSKPKTTNGADSISLDAVILIGEQDFAFADEIKKAFSAECEVLKDQSILHGGFIIKDDKKRLYFDETLEEKLYEQKPYFIEKCGFEI